MEERRWNGKFLKVESLNGNMNVFKLNILESWKFWFFNLLNKEILRVSCFCWSILKWRRWD